MQAPLYEFLTSSYAEHMTMTDSSRAAELASRFTASRAADEQLTRAGAAERRAIVNELLTLMKPPEVAQLLGISVARVGQIVGGVRRRMEP